jgi:NAD(P)H-dependent FMN reductase
MSKTPLNVLAVAGSLQQTSVTRIAIRYAAEQLVAAGCHVDVLDLKSEALGFYDPDTTRHSAGYAALQRRVGSADVILLGTPDYHGSVSGVMKNFLDHFWQEFAGKLFATIVASHEKGLTVTDQLRTVARQCYAWTLPYGVAFCEEDDIKDGQVASEGLMKRLGMMLRDARVYGEVLARQRAADMAGTEPGFMARHRR